MQASVPLTPVQLDVSTALKLTKNKGMFKERSLMAQNDSWHRIKILHGAKYDKEFVLKAILTAAEPADLIPVRYQLTGSTDTCFIARNCGPALEKLCQSNLIIKIPNCDPLILVVTLAFASIQDLKVSIQPLLLASITKRYNSNNQSLDLNNFHREEDIAKHVYCPLSQTRTFSHVLRLTKSALASFEHLNLQNNDLTCLTALESANLSTIKSLDLRNNCLLGMETLTPIRSLTITELWLDGNPLCENYSSSKQYIESALKYCPHLTKLDGVLLDDINMPAIINNYFPNEKLEKLVKQFANHYFILHDQMDRMLLKALYYKNAVYSLTLGMKGSGSRKNLGPYISDNRNMADQSGISKTDNLLYNGPDEIVGAIKRLPRCLHDRTSFHYDIMYSNRNTIVVVIDGIVKLANVVPQILSFNRIFVLVAQADNEYKIVNDQYHVDTAVPETVTTNFDKQLLNINYEVTSVSQREKDEMTMLLMQLTTMKDKWAWKFLEDVNWDLKRAILNFMHAYDSSRMPAEAFSLN